MAAEALLTNPILIPKRGGPITQAVEAGLGSYHVQQPNVDHQPSDPVPAGRNLKRAGRWASLATFGAIALAACTPENSNSQPTVPATSEFTPAPTVAPAAPEADSSLPDELQVTRELREVTDPIAMQRHVGALQTLLKSAFVDPSEGVNNDPQFWSSLDTLQNTPADELDRRLTVHVETRNDSVSGNLESWTAKYKYWEQPTNPNEELKPIPDMEVSVYHPVGSPAVITIYGHMGPDGSFTAYENTEPTNDYATLLNNASRIFGAPGREFVPAINDNGMLSQDISLGRDRYGLHGSAYENGMISASIYAAPGTEASAAIPDDTQSTLVMDNNAYLASDITVGSKTAEQKRQLLAAITDPALAAELAVAIDFAVADDVAYDARIASTVERFIEVEAAIDAIPTPDARQAAEVAVDFAQADEAVDTADSAYSPEGVAQAKVLADWVEDPALRERTKALIGEAEVLNRDYSDAGYNYDHRRYNLSDEADQARYDLSDRADAINNGINRRVRPVW